ncbi:hypothetical protein M5689_015303 [Euphorbia peplus]|nr:hypothetical protein M5689_015303 [Euphorbia peplus]
MLFIRLITSFYSLTEEDMELGTPLHPWLLIQDATDKCKLIYYDVSEKKYYKKMIPDMENKEVCSSSYGWFILKDCALKVYYLFNPITLEMIQLPPLPQDQALDSYLYLSPNDSNCHVIFFDEINSTLFFCKPKDAKFIQQWQNNFGGFTMLGEKGYCWGYGYFAAITFQGSQIVFDRLLVETPDLEHHSYHGGIWSDIYLVESCGELLFVCKLKLYAWKVYRIVVFKFDFEEKKWVEIENIGHSTIFLSSSKGAIACRTQEVRKNLVYFFNPDERFFNIFNIENRGFSMMLPCHVASAESKFHWILTDGSHPI